jgi:hypothetical protein
MFSYQTSVALCVAFSGLCLLPLALDYRYAYSTKE